jgi:hypothetical protein
MMWKPRPVPGRPAAPPPPVVRQPKPICTVKPPVQPNRPPQVVCFNVAAPAPAARPSFSPTGGPASGLWANGGNVPAPAPTPTPTPPPTPTCVNADLFADCFTAGNVGWTVLTPPGSVVFADQKMYMGSVSGGISPDGRAEKSLSGLPVDAWTLRYEFTEVDSVPTFNKDYTIATFDNLGNSIAVLSLIGDGTGFAADFQTIYSLVWIPVQGATHSVIMKGDSSGNLTVSIDGVPAVLIPFSPGPGTGTPNVLLASITNNDSPAGLGSFDSIFFSNGNIPDNTPFCCP